MLCILFHNFWICEDRLTNRSQILWVLIKIKGFALVGLLQYWQFTWLTLHITRWHLRKRTSKTITVLLDFLFLFVSFFFLCVHLQFQTNMKNWTIYHSIEYLNLKSDILSHWIADRWIPQIQQGLFYTLPFTCKCTVNVG